MQFVPPVMSNAAVAQADSPKIEVYQTVYTRLSRAAHSGTG